MGRRKAAHVLRRGLSDEHVVRHHRVAVRHLTYLMASRKARRWVLVAIYLVGAAMPWTSSVHAEDTPELAQLAQNPIAKVISLPLQDNLNFGVGANNDKQDTLNIQPVVPFNVGTDWNVVARAIIPLEYEPPLGPMANSTVGLGDASLALYLSPSHPGSIIWGVGPGFTSATASHSDWAFRLQYQLLFPK